jgi:hypothetical protein
VKVTKQTAFKEKSEIAKQAKTETINFEYLSPVL